jgi:AbrB family looped-hinge helix DNA binding protein
MPHPTGRPPPSSARSSACAAETLRLGQDKIQAFLARQGIRRSTATINRILHARRVCFFVWTALEQGSHPCYCKDMAKVTSKLQVTVPKAVAEHYGIRPGDEIEWLVSGDTIRVVPPGKKTRAVSPAERLRRFDLATARQQKRDKRPHEASAQSRGWSREELYRRGRAR